MGGERHLVDTTVNGRRYRREVESRMLLTDFLRRELRLTGTHVGCAHGVCGACTIEIDGKTARSCLTFAVQVDQCEIRTVEGLAGDGPLDVLQQAFHENHALQCGFCTPGFLMAAHQLLNETMDPSKDDIRLALSGNLCRCTGYVNIVRAVAQAAATLRAQADDAKGANDGG